MSISHNCLTHINVFAFIGFPGQLFFVKLFIRKRLGQDIFKQPSLDINTSAFTNYARLCIDQHWTCCNIKW